jgi:type II restriction enzyme
MRQAFFLLFLLVCGGSLPAQDNYPAQVDGYKVERAKVEVKRSGDAAPDADAFVKIGEPKLVRVTPLGVTFEIPLTVNPVKQGGRVERLLFEDVEVNETAVEIDDYIAPFDLPNKKPLTLKRPVRVFVSAPKALANVVGNIWRAEETWPVRGRVYVFGRFKKFLFKFKRVVPVEFDLTIPNPLRRDEKGEPHHAPDAAQTAQNHNNRTLAEIESRYYFLPIKQLYDQRRGKYGAAGALDRLSEIMREATPEVEKTIQARVAKGDIKDADQARKSVAGNAFQALAVYALIKLQQSGGLPAHLVITLKPRQHPQIERYATIQVGDEIQKPDIDLLIFSATQDKRLPVVIYSVKTSLRERAGQTYRWKLLLDVATGGCQDLRERYQLRYETQVPLKLGFITADFYDEITNPQQEGALKFFDFAYLTKPDKASAASNFSKAADDLQTLYKVSR